MTLRSALSAVRTRTLAPEIMDDPALDPQHHAAALRGLARLNRAARSSALLWPELREFARRHGETRSLRVLDLACGSGDLPIALARRARKAELPLELSGADISPRAVEHARANAARAGVAVSFQTLDALHDPIPDGFDVLCCSLFLHHLSAEDARRLLARMAAAARLGIVVSDLRRSRRGYLLAWLASRTLTRSPVVHTDALLSVRAAWTPGEVRALAADAGLRGVHVALRWPQRFVLRWSRT